MAVGVSTATRHPPGLWYLAFTELWERFSYYGMTALMTLYMVKQLLLPDHASQVAGLGAVRTLFEFRGPMADAAFASLLYGWYSGLVYFTPLLGGWIADRWLGAKRTVTIGALLMAAGHLAMSFDESFLVALGLLILGSGCLKGNISAQVGTLYPPDDESRRTRGYILFSAAINAGAVLGPLACGGVAAVYGWHAGFALAAGLMLVALGVYLAGQRHLPDQRTARADKAALPPLTPAEKKRAWWLAVAIALAVAPQTAYMMIWSIGTLWVDQHVDLTSPFGPVPASWFNSIDSFAAILATVPLIALWAWQSRRHREPGSIAKVGIGSAIIGLSALLIALGNFYPNADGKVPVLWALVAWSGMGIGFLYYWPPTLALVSHLAPARINSTMMGTAFLAMFAASLLMGWVGSFYVELSPAAFWMIDGGIGLAGALLVLLVHRPLARALNADRV